MNIIWWKHLVSCLIDLWHHSVSAVCGVSSHISETIEDRFIIWCRLRAVHGNKKRVKTVFKTYMLSSPSPPPDSGIIAITTTSSDVPNTCHFLSQNVSTTSHSCIVLSVVNKWILLLLLFVLECSIFYNDYVTRDYDY